MTSDSPPPTLDNIDLLKPLSPADRAAIARQCRWRRYAPYEQVIDRMSDTRDVCLVVNGRVRVVNHSLSGREVSFDDVDAGGFFGELSAIDGEPRSATVEALDDTLIAFIPSSVFFNLVTDHPQLARSLLVRLTSIVRRSTERIMDLSTLGANNRVHAELVRLGKRNFNAKTNIAEITPIPVHSDIAARVSTTRETVARVMNDLAREGLVERRTNSLAILDFRALEQMVEDVRGL